MERSPGLGYSSVLPDCAAPTGPASVKITRSGEALSTVNMNGEADASVIEIKQGRRTFEPQNFAASSNGAFVTSSNERGPEGRFQLRVDALTYERDSYQELLRDAVSRIFDLENRLKIESEHPEVELLQQKATEMFRKSKSNIAALNLDISELRQMYATERKAKDNMRLRLVASQKELELLKITSRMLENSAKESEATIKRLSDESFSMQQSLAAADAAMLSWKQERSLRVSESQLTVERNLILAQKIEELERKNSELMMKLEEAVDCGERAMRERNQLALRLREHAAELTELREDETKTYKEITERAKRDVFLIKQTSEDITSHLKDDIRQLEGKLTDKDIELNRSLREMKTLQLHIERLERDASTTSRETSAPEEIYRRVAVAEQDRDRLRLLVQSTQSSLKLKIDQMGQQELKFEKSMKDQNTRLKETVERCKQLNDEHVQMAEEIRRLEGELGVKEKSLQILNREIQGEIYSMKEKVKLGEADRIAREQAMDESQKQSLLDMQQVNKLLRQQVAHWQAEFNNLQNMNELRVRDLKEKLSKSKMRQLELEREVLRHSNLNTEMLGRMDEVKHAMVSLTTLE